MLQTDVHYILPNILQMGFQITKTIVVIETLILVRSERVFLLFLPKTLSFFLGTKGFPITLATFHVD